MATSQNGWEVLESGSSRLHRWAIPTKEGMVYIVLRNGSAGFLICHFLLWWADVIEPLFGKVLDDWGYAVRPVRGQTSGYSNHASATAADANATRHPLGTRTLSMQHKALIKTRVALYRGALRSGVFYSSRPDEMHVEIDKSLTFVEKVARDLVDSPRGKRILEANPGQREVIFS